ncbi:MAG: KilA-N domain-containing protein [Bacteroidia bacterium]|nr:KilA-N domain-containing protein [Bacteroidia bacterium]
MKTTINIKGTEISIIKKESEDYFSLTDIVKHFGDDTMIYSWMRSRYTLEFLGVWEELNNSDFKGNEFVTFKMEAGLNTFNLTPKKWIEATKAIGIISKSGRYGGGTYAHKDIAFEFGSWLSPEFKMYLIKEFQRLKEDENGRLKLEWNFQRTLAKVNYRIHTDAIKEKLIPPQLSREKSNQVYASEGDLLNVALYGMTAKEWKESNPQKEGNIRDHSSIEQLIVLSNLESLNSILIMQSVSQKPRLVQLNNCAIFQMRSLLSFNKKPDLLREEEVLYRAEKKAA